MTNAMVEQQKLKLYKATAETFITATLRIEQVPWVACAGPSTWRALQAKEAPVYLWEIDSRQVSASKLLGQHDKLAHDIEAALAPFGLDVRVSIKNSVGLGIMFDERPVVKIDLIDALSDVERCLIVGASNAGKTTLLQHLVADRLAAGFEVIVIDPHASPGKWPVGTQVIGAGERYEEIEVALQEIKALKKARYEEIAAGLVPEGGHPRTLIIIDEYYDLSVHIKGLSFILLSLLTGGRKANMHTFTGVHSDDVRTLGIEGQGKLRKGFVLVRLELNEDHQRIATIDFGNGAKAAELPGPYVPQTLPPALPPAPALRLKDFHSKSGEWCITTDDQKRLVAIGHFLMAEQLPVTATAKETAKRPLTRHLKHHMLKDLFAHWEHTGLLEPAPAVNQARRITPELLALAGLKPKQ